MQATVERHQGFWVAALGDKRHGPHADYSDAMAGLVEILPADTRRGHPRPVKSVDGALWGFNVPVIATRKSK